MELAPRIFPTILIGALVMGCTGERKTPDGKHEVTNKQDEHIRIRAGDEEFVLVPDSVSKATAEAALPSKRSEDVSHLLGKIDIPVSAGVNSEVKEYLLFETVEWVLSVEFPGNPRLDPKKFEEMFDAKWRKEFGGFTTFGRDADSGLWTFAISADGPRAITHLKLEWSYVPFSDDFPEQTARLYEQRLSEVSKKLKVFGEPKIRASLSPTEAAQRAKQLQALKASLDQSVVSVLKHLLVGDLKARRSGMLCSASV